MAGTTSATRRQSYVSTAMPAAGLKRFLGMLHALGKGDTTRGVIVFTALALSLAGAVAPHIDANLLAALFFLCAAALALIATARSLDGTTGRPFSLPASPSSEPRTPVQRVRPLPRTLQELAAANEGGQSGQAVDLHHWYRITHRMSHELRTPLNAVLGFSELMASEAFGPLGSPQYVDYANSINASGRTLLKSAEDALAITSMLTGLTSRNRTNAASVRNGFNDMLAFHQIEQGRPGIDLSKWDDAGCEIVGEAQTLRQILINVLAVTLEHARQGACAKVACAHDAEEVRISFSIEGPNAPASVREDNFSLLLARTLIQLSQARMEETSSVQCWSAVLVFQRANQQDFFAAA